MLGRAFDPDRPLVATSAFQSGDRVVAAGEAFDWRAEGLSQLDALAMFSAGLLTHAAAEPSAEAPKKRRSKQQPQPTE